MKKILSAAIVAATTLMLGATALASCPLKNQTSCNTGQMTGAAAPMTYVVAPVQQRTYLPPCKNCVPKKNGFQKIMTPFTGVYNAVFGPFTNLYN